MDQPSSEAGLPYPLALSQTMARIAAKSQSLLQGYAERHAKEGASMGMGDPVNVFGAMMQAAANLAADPGKVMQAQYDLARGYAELWQSTMQRMWGMDPGPVAEPEHGDRRFRDEAWSENVYFDYFKQSYLITARWLQNTVAQIEGLDEKTAQKVDFYTRQFVDAIAPSNFVMTNPEVLRQTIDSGGENLVRGLENLLDDLDRGQGQLRISQTDEDAFEVGRNIAVTPGKVVYQNDLMQLIQYAPTTDKVHRRPLLIIPPWINKFYILDLRPKNSFIRWCVSKGLTVFIISWVNPDADLAQKTFEDYMLEGPLAALDAIEKATGEKKVNVVGYCLGGTLLSATLAYMAVKEDKRIATATFLTALTSFDEPGELGVFIDEEQLNALEHRMNESGYLDGAAMANTFNMMRANDLIWSFVINNYLLGKDPFPFDLLYWNSDSTRMPAEMHSFYLRQMYQENKLTEPGGLQLADTPIDLRKIKVPAFFLSTREDHIAPWKTTYEGTQLLSGKVRFCLSASGHIAGVVNPPEAEKYCHWTNDETPADPDDWFSDAKQAPGSWWPEWLEWLRPKSGAQVPARQPGDGKLKAIEDAPGAYVKVRVVDEHN